MSRKGLTVIELLIVLVIFSIILVSAAPSFQIWVENTRVRTLANDLASSFYYARSEAIRRGISVSICPQTADFTSCGTDWSNGWIVFLNANTDTVFNNSAEEPALIVHDAASSSLTVINSPLSNMVTFSSRGFISTTTTTFTIAGPACADNRARTVALSATGQATLLEAACPP